MSTPRYSIGPGLPEHAASTAQALLCSLLISKNLVFLSVSFHFVLKVQIVKSASSNTIFFINVVAILIYRFLCVVSHKDFETRRREQTKTSSLRLVILLYWISYILSGTSMPSSAMPFLMVFATLAASIRRNCFCSCVSALRIE